MLKETNARWAITSSRWCGAEPRQLALRCPPGLPVDDCYLSVLSYLTLMKPTTPLYFVPHFTRVAVGGRISCGMYGDASG
jgi:hypothetical protein